MENKDIVLNDVENTLRQLLLDVVNFIEQNPVKPSPQESHIVIPHELTTTPLQLRWTGGWVRDKLLGVESQDIDVAINKMTGYQFGLRMQQYLSDESNASKYQHPDGSTKSWAKLHKIDANPDKSKHLETTTTKILGLDIDLVNLRKETYLADSRNPLVEFGTPEEDASRRDATINSMFYNVSTGQVEDFTNQGLKDLRDGIIRTPLEPHTTFLDDPLRVLRLIRFAVRYDYTLESSTQKAMAASDIKQALVAKISRERVCVEVDKILKGPRPMKGLKLINNLGLYFTIFADPTQAPTWLPTLDHWEAVIDFYHQLAKEPSSEAQKQFQQLAIPTVDDKYHGWLLTAFVPWVNAPDAAPQKKGRPAPHMAVTAAREGIKSTTKLNDLLSLSLRHMGEIRTMKDDKDITRDKLGMAVRTWGKTWTLQVTFAMLHDVFEDPSIRDNILEQYAAFMATAKNFDVLEAYDFKTLIDGKQLAKELNTPPGPWMKEALNVVMNWQLRHPDITKLDDARDALLEEIGQWKAKNEADAKQPPKKKQKNQGELTSALISHFLRLTLRPIFSQAKRPEVTTAGRHNINAKIEPPDHRNIFAEDASPWKTKDSWSLDILMWVCKSLNEETVQKEWGVLIPPVLTVLDDTDTQTKARGCGMVKHLLEATPPKLLRQSGLTPVFEEALLSCTHHLPRLTEEADSVVILNAAYPALLALINTAFPKQPSPEPYPSARTKALTKVLREGIFGGYSHAGENIRIAETLLKILPSILDEMGIDSVVHLKHLIPMLENLLDDPFGLASPSLMITALKAVHSVLRNAWPRVPVYRGNVLRGVCGLWLRMESEDEQGLKEAERIRIECILAVDMLDSVMQANKEFGNLWKNEVKQMIESDERLQELFDNVNCDDEPLEKEAVRS